MKYICSATIKQLTEQPQNWLSFIAYLFKITQCLEVFSTLLPAVALDHYSSEKAKQALMGIRNKFVNTKKHSQIYLNETLNY